MKRVFIVINHYWWVILSVSKVGVASTRMKTNFVSFPKWIEIFGMTVAGHTKTRLCFFSLVL